MMACSASLLIWHGSALATLPSVTLEAAREALEKSNAIVVDIREPGEHANGVAKGALDSDGAICPAFFRVAQICNFTRAGHVQYPKSILPNC